MIVTVPLEKDTVWLECTSKYTPFGYLGTFTQNREALLVNGLKSGFIKTPALQPSQVLEKRNIDLNIADDGTTKAALHYAFRGDNFDRFSYVLTNYNKAEQERVIRRMIPVSSFDLESWELSKDHRDSEMIHLKISFSTSDFLKAYGNDYILAPVSFDIPEFEAPKKRQLPVRLMYPISQEVSVKVSLPDKWETKSVPARAEAEGPIGKYLIESESNQKAVSLRKTFALYSGDYTNEEYHALYDFVAALKIQESSNLIVFHKTSQ